MKQRITAVVTIDVDTDGLDWAKATEIARVQIAQTSETYLKRVIRMEIVEED